MGVIFHRALRHILISASLLLCLPGGRLQAQQARADAAKTMKSAVDESIPDDPTTAAIVAPFRVKVSALDVVVGTLDVELKKKGIGGGTLGNFVADAMRQRAEQVLGRSVLLAVTNSGGLRRNAIAPGQLRAADIYELLPFENALVTVELNGEQLWRFLQVIMARGDAQSGAVLSYRKNDADNLELVSASLGPQQNEINKTATYTVVTIDYLVKRGGDYSVLQEAKNVRPLNLTMRDAVLDYVKAETAAKRSIRTQLDGRFQSVDKNAENK